MEGITHIGIVAVSAEGAALCYRTICTEGAELLGPHAHPEVTMHTYPLAEYMRPVDAGRWDEAGELLLASANILSQAGAELLICPDNTLHQALDVVRERSPARWLHIAEEVARVATHRQFNRLGILGTRYLMEGPVYPKKCLLQTSTGRSLRFTTVNASTRSSSTSWYMGGSKSARGATCKASSRPSASVGATRLCWGAPRFRC